MFSKMGKILKNDVEKIIEEACQRAEKANSLDVETNFGHRMKKQITDLMARDTSYGGQIKGTVSGGSVFFSKINRLTKSGRKFEEFMDKVENKQLREATTKNEYWAGGTKYFETESTRGQLMTHRGKNEVQVDLVFSGAMWRINSNEVGKGDPTGYDMFDEDKWPVSVEEELIPKHLRLTKKQQDVPYYRTPHLKTDSFQYLYKQRVDEANRINAEKQRELGYNPDLTPLDEGYSEQVEALRVDPRYIPVQPDTFGLPEFIYDNEGYAYKPDYDVVIHVNGVRLEGDDLDMVFKHMARKGEFEKPRLEAGRDFLVQQGVRGAAFHASIIPQRAAEGAIKAPSKVAREGEQIVAATFLSQIMQSLSRGTMSR